MRKILILSALVAVTLATISLVATRPIEGRPVARFTLLEVAYSQCRIGTYGRITDHGKTLIITGINRRYDSASYEVDMECLLGRVEMPMSAVTKAERTRALDGQVETSWGRFKASWTYYPDEGLNMIIETVEGK